jgi:hypothetical protein
MRSGLASIIEYAAGLLQRSYSIWPLAGVGFLSTYYFWAIILVRTYSSNVIFLQVMPLALLPAFFTALGIVLCFLIAYVGRAVKVNTFMKSLLFSGVIIDLLSYVIDGSYTGSMLVYLCFQILMLFLCLGMLRFGLLKIIGLIGIASLVVPWIVTPVCPQALVCGAVETSQTPQSLVPTLVIQGYKGYNIIEYNNTFYAILQSEGAFSYSKIQSGGYSSYFIGNSVDQVEQEINAKAG